MSVKTATPALHTVDSIKNLLSTSNAAVERALIVLFKRQTADEQTSETTKYVNGRGFNAMDAEILSSFAAQVQRKVGQYSDRLGRNRVLGECLTERQMDIARRRVPRYAKQLLEAAQEKAALKAALANATVAAEPVEIVIERAEALGLDVEREMHLMEVAADREGTLRDERAKFNARRRMEATTPAAKEYGSIRKGIADFVNSEWE